MQQIVSVRVGLQRRDKMEQHKHNWNASTCLFPVDFQRSLIDKFKWESLWTCVDMLSVTYLPESQQKQFFVQTWVFSIHRPHLLPLMEMFSLLSEFHFSLLFLMCRLSVTTLWSTANAASALKYFTVSTQSWNCHSRVFVLVSSEQ